LPTSLPSEASAPLALTGAERLVRACLRQPVDRTPVWFLRQAGRYMAEYQAVRAHHSLLDICRTPALSAEVTITAAEKLDVDAAIIFADLLLPLTPMGLDFEFVSGDGPVVHAPVRNAEAVTPTAPRSLPMSPSQSQK
jgi:uroporphyrinogen decarboxylase